MNVLELFCGIGGMHAALRETNSSFNVVGAYEVNPVALAIYKNNYANCGKFKEKNIMGLTVEEFQDMKPDLLTMSPPCQPFTRQGLKKDSNDTRCSPLLHILSIIRNASFLPKFIFLENVAGFETSDAHAKLLEVLSIKKFSYQEFLLSPSQFGIPNSRLRYYLIAKLVPLEFGFKTSSEIHKSFPVCLCISFDSTTSETIAQEPHAVVTCSVCSKLKLNSVRLIVQNRFSNFLINSTHLPIEDVKLPLSNFLDKEASELFLLNQKTLIKYAIVFDIVHSNTFGSCCFTKGYGHYVKGTGSVFTCCSEEKLKVVYEEIKNLSEDDPRYSELLCSLKLRYFTPQEILKLMCFPEDFKIPPNCTTKQSYKVLGNSINVFVVSLLMTILFQ